MPEKKQKPRKAEIGEHFDVGEKMTCRGCGSITELPDWREDGRDKSLLYGCPICTATVAFVNGEVVSVLPEDLNELH